MKKALAGMLIFAVISGVLTINLFASTNNSVSEVKANIYRNGVYYKTVTISQNNNWIYEDDFEKTDENGKEYIYTIKEIPVSGYSSSVMQDGNSFALINIPIPSTPAPSALSTSAPETSDTYSTTHYYPKYEPSTKAIVSASESTSPTIPPSASPENSPSPSASVAPSTTAPFETNYPGSSTASSATEFFNTPKEETQPIPEFTFESEEKAPEGNSRSADVLVEGKNLHLEYLDRLFLYNVTEDGVPLGYIEPSKYNNFTLDDILPDIPNIDDKSNVFAKPSENNDNHTSGSYSKDNVPGTGESADIKQNPETFDSLSPKILIISLLTVCIFLYITKNYSKLIS